MKIEQHILKKLMDGADGFAVIVMVRDGKMKAVEFGSDRTHRSRAHRFIQKLWSYGSLWRSI